MTYQSNNKNIFGATPQDKLSVFNAAKNLEITDANQHFLRIGGITNGFLNGPAPDSPSGSTGVNPACSMMIRKAIWQFYQVFDHTRFATFKNPKGVMTSIVWAKYRELHRDWMLGHDNYLLNNARNAKARYKADRERGHLKRQEKEKAEMLRMGNGDIEKGKQKFVERMVKEKSVKLNTVHDVSLALEQKFAEWLKTDAAAKYSKPLTDCYTKQFAIYEYSFGVTKYQNINLKVNSQHGVVSALTTLAKSARSNQLFITGTFGWDEKSVFSNPATHVYTTNGILALGSSGRVLQNEKVNIRGLINNDGKYYIVSNKFTSAYQLFPKEFEKFESRNPKVSSRLSVCYNIDNALASLQVFRFENGVKYVMNVNIISTAPDIAVNVLSIFDDYKDPVVAVLQAQSAKEIARKIKELEEKKRDAGIAGLKKSLEVNKEKLKGLQGMHSKNSSGVAGLKKSLDVNKSVDSTDQIMKLCEAFEKGLLDKTQFETAKNKILR